MTMPPESFDQQIARLRAAVSAAAVAPSSQADCRLCANCQLALAELLRRWDAVVALSASAETAAQERRVQMVRALAALIDAINRVWPS